MATGLSGNPTPVLDAAVVAGPEFSTTFDPEAAADQLAADVEAGRTPSFQVLDCAAVTLEQVDIATGVATSVDANSHQ